jgi:hypothetical protein
VDCSSQPDAHFRQATQEELEAYLRRAPDARQHLGGVFGWAGTVPTTPAHTPRTLQAALQNAQQVRRHEQHERYAWHGWQKQRREMIVRNTLLGAVAGLVAGLVFGMMMQMMTAPAPDGSQIPMMRMVAMVIRSDSVAAGWVYHLFNSAVIGAIFGALLGTRVQGYSTGLGWGALYGVVWWVLGGLILMPVLLGMPPFASLVMAPMRPIALGSMMGHIIYGLILGAGYVWLATRQAAAQSAGMPRDT